MASHHNMVSPQNNDTRGGFPLPPSDATNWRYSIFFYLSMQRTVLNTFRFLLISLVNSKHAWRPLLSNFQQKFALVTVFDILPLNF